MEDYNPGIHCSFLKSEPHILLNNTNATSVGPLYLFWAIWPKILITVFCKILTVSLYRFFSLEWTHLLIYAEKGHLISCSPLFFHHWGPVRGEQLFVLPPVVIPAARQTSINCFLIHVGFFKTSKQLTKLFSWAQVLLVQLFNSVKHHNTSPSNN